MSNNIILDSRNNVWVAGRSYRLTASQTELLRLLLNGLVAKYENIEEVLWPCAADMPETARNIISVHVKGVRQRTPLKIINIQSVGYYLDLSSVADTPAYPRDLDLTTTPLAMEDIERWMRAQGADIDELKRARGKPMEGHDD